MSKKQSKEYITLPVLALRGMSVFPSTITHFEVGREKSLLALDFAMENDQLIFLTTQKNMDIEFPLEEDIYKIGTICKVKQTLKIPGNNLRVLVEGLGRGRIEKLTQNDPFFEADIEHIFDKPIRNEKTVSALMDIVTEAFEELMKENGKNAQEFFDLGIDLDDAGVFSDSMASYIGLKSSVVQELIEQLDPEKRLNTIYVAIKEELATREIKKRVEKRVNKQVSKQQKDYYLREQIKAIQKELGEDDTFADEIESYRKKLKDLKLKEKVTEKINKEIDKLARMASSSSEAVVTRNYIETLLDMPWNHSTTDNEDLNRSIEILEAEHFGLEKVKERIVEFLAVRQLSDKMKAPIICLLGPPGVGKTSISRSIANAMNRNFVRMSLGGVRDEAEIRGHRRTYVGAIPGRIINSIKEAGTNNPVFLLDEIDKMASDFRGDPASAMLEVLDPEQNKEFTDHYLEVPFDLSHVVFITTANNASSIPAPLLDRMDLIEISGYTELEKLQIAKKYLIAKQAAENGLPKDFLKISDDVIKYIINNYTRESGVRNLERRLGKIARKVAVKKVKEPSLKSQRIQIKDVKEFLGKEIKRNEVEVTQSKVGEAT